RPAPVPGGHGLLGMRERAAAAGGQLRTGAAPGGGFLVEATLPAKPEAASASRRGAALPGLRSEERATREGDASKRPGGEREAAHEHRT
ncbi:MAG TPA: hypothetical protein VE733_15900, partial [Streptosporangiaceae bacterium]|nr:hypothetical protein [Streptosporangiaceae bacterium]